MSMSEMKNSNLDAVPDADPVVQQAEVLAGTHARLLLELLRGVLEALGHEVVHDELVHGGARHADVVDLLHPLVLDAGLLPPRHEGGVRDALPVETVHAAVRENGKA